MTDEIPPTFRGVGLLNEKPLHAALKAWYAQPGDRFEANVDGSVIDIVRGEPLVEIQTRGFSALKRKLEKLVVSHPVRLVFPSRLRSGSFDCPMTAPWQEGRRTSPERGSIPGALPRIGELPAPHLPPQLLPGGAADPGRRGAAAGSGADCEDGAGGRWSAAWCKWLNAGCSRPRPTCARSPRRWMSRSPPPGWPMRIDQPRWLARKMAYCFRSMGALVGNKQAGQGDPLPALLTRRIAG